MRQVYGIGESKLAAFGELFLDRIVGYCRDHAVALDATVVSRTEESGWAGPSMNARRAFPFFRAGASIELVMQETGMSRGTVCGYLCDYIRTEKPRSLAPWISDERYQQIAAAARLNGTQFLKPIHVALGEKMTYDEIRIVAASLQAQGEE